MALVLNLEVNLLGKDQFHLEGCLLQVQIPSFIKLLIIERDQLK